MENKIIWYIKNNNPKGLDLLIDNYSKNIYLLVKSIIRDCATEDDIENCVSEIFIDIYTGIDSFNKEKLTFNKFILLKCKTRALDYKTKFTQSKTEFSNINENIINSQDVFEEESIEYDSKELIKIIRSFKEPDKTYFYLAYFRDYDIDTLAKKFNDNVNGIQNKIIKCKFKLKTILKKGETVSGR